MWWLFQWMVVYVLGGFTFVPLVLAAVIWYAMKYGSVPIGDSDPFKLRKATLQNQSERDEYLARARAQNDTAVDPDTKDTPAATSGIVTPPKPLSGWLTVRRQFKPNNHSLSLFSTTSSQGTDLAGAEVDKGERDLHQKDSEDSTSIASWDQNIKGDKKNYAASIASSTNGSAASTSASSSTTTLGATSTNTANSLPVSGQPTSTSTSTSGILPNTMSGRIAQTYRSMVEARTARTSPPKEFFYCVLKGSVLFLYEDEEQSDCVAAIGVDRYITGIEGPNGAFEGKDAEMFAKRNALVLRVHNTFGDSDGTDGGKKGLPMLAKGMAGAGLGSSGSTNGTAGGLSKGKEDELESAPWYLFSKSNTKFEDWYLALTAVSALKPTFEDVFSSNDMQDLINVIDTEADPIPMRWLNGFLGRMFFALYRTAAVEQFIIDKIMKKLSKVSRPSFLSPIIIREVNIGTSPPFFSKPMLKDLTAEGTASFEVNVRYRARPNQPDAEIRITVATTATIPTGFKPYSVDLVLAVVIKSFEGNLVLQMKKPPSNRVWYGFTTMPKTEIEIIPVVSERKIQIGMVLKAMEKQLREVIAESIVLPNMDDLAIFDTSTMDVRGGVFDEAGKVYRDTKREEPRADETASISPPASEVATSHEDPNSATVEQNVMRKRGPTKAQTHDQRRSNLAMGEDDDKPGFSISRIDTAPALLNSSSSSPASTTAKTSAIEVTRKWFSNAPRVPSISSKAVKDEPKNRSDDSLTLAPVRSADSARSGSEQAADAMNRVQTAAKTSTVISEPHKDKRESSHMGSLTFPHLLGADSTKHLHESPATSPISIKPSEGSSSRSVSGVDPSAAAASSTSLLDTTTAGERSAAAAQTQALINSIRARDKQAIASQVNATRDSIKKWGINFAAKRRGEIRPAELNDAKDQDRPAANYQPSTSPEDRSRGMNIASGPGTGSGSRASSEVARSNSPGKSLQDRLNAAAHAATLGSPPSSSSGMMGRHRSGSSLSQSSTDASGLMAVNKPPRHNNEGSILPPTSTSPPKFGLSSAKPTTEVVKNAASAHATPIPPSTQDIAKSATADLSASSTTPRRDSAPASVASASYDKAKALHTLQPSAGRSMVVPRVIKRPGEVTGIGSTESGMVRRVSNDSDAAIGTGRGGEKTGIDSSASSGSVDATGTTGSAGTLLSVPSTGQGNVPPPSLPTRKSLDAQRPLPISGNGIKTPPALRSRPGSIKSGRCSPPPPAAASTSTGGESKTLVSDGSVTLSSASAPSNDDAPPLPPRHDAEPIFDLDLNETTNTGSSVHGKRDPVADEDATMSSPSKDGSDVAANSLHSRGSGSGAEQALRALVARQKHMEAEKERKREEEVGKQDVAEDHA